MSAVITFRSVNIPTDTAVLEGDLAIPSGATGIVLFAHGSGSSRFSHRNLFVADALHKHGLATLLFDLLTAAEEQEDELDGRHRFNIALLKSRLVQATDWVLQERETAGLPVAYFGASTGAAAALLAAAARPSVVRAIIARGGRPDLALHELHLVAAPTLLIVGERDGDVLLLNQVALEELRCDKRLVTVPRAAHLFHEAGALEMVAEFACAWLTTHLSTRAAGREMAILQ